MVKCASRPLLLGHRGVRPISCNDAGPDVPAENTIRAFDYALANGCDGFEFDVRFTRDKRAVLCHDPQLDGKEISATDYRDLSRDRPDLACLEDVLARFGDTAYLDIELKTSGNEEAIVAALRASAPARGYVISSFLPEILFRIRAIDGELPLGYICDRPSDATRWTALPISVFIPHHSLVSSKLVEDAHRRGLKLLTWTVNQKSDLLRLAAWGVDGLISDDPRLLSSTFPAAG